MEDADDEAEEDEDGDEDESQDEEEALEEEEDEDETLQDGGAETDTSEEHFALSADIRGDALWVESDDVYRCVLCTYEVADGICHGCWQRYDVPTVRTRRVSVLRLIFISYVRLAMKTMTFSEASRRTTTPFILTAVSLLVGRLPP
jgi:hypothetical protein